MAARARLVQIDGREEPTGPSMWASVSLFCAIPQRDYLLGSYGNILRNSYQNKWQVEDLLELEKDPTGAGTSLGQEG